jgi:hypothetical protein
MVFIGNRKCRLQHWTLMTSKHFIPLGLRVMLGFGVFVALASAIMYGASLLPSPEQGCREHCAVLGKSGTMVPIYRWEQTAGMHGTGPAECKCS